VSKVTRPRGEQLAHFRVIPTRWISAEDNTAEVLVDRGLPVEARMSRPGPANASNRGVRFALKGWLNTCAHV
jgi:hypothetical protein